MMLLFKRIKKLFEISTDIWNISVETKMAILI